MNGLELFKRYEELYSMYISSCTELDELCDDIYELDEYYVCHHIEYSDEFWENWDTMVGLSRKRDERKALEKHRDELESSSGDAKSKFLDWALSGGIRFSKSKRRVLMNYYSECFPVCEDDYSIALNTPGRKLSESSGRHLQHEWHILRGNKKPGPFGGLAFL